MRVSLVIGLILSTFLTKGQDLHFSQFYASPLSVSPSYTGFFNGDYRLGGNLKTQWPWGIQQNAFTYRTLSAYTDFALLRNILPGKDVMGLGLILLNDNAGDGRLSATKIFLSLAYHKALGYKERFFLSFGINGGYVQKGVDYDKLFFNDNWDPANLLFNNQNITTSEPIGNNVHYFDLAAGVHFSYFHNEQINFSAGISLFHIYKPGESFSGGANRLGVRPVVNAMAYLAISRKVHVEPGVIYMYQKSAQEFIINILAGFKVAKGSFILIGSSYRYFDAYIPLAGFQYKMLRVLLNFDVNLSSLTNASSGNGGFEMSVVYTGIRKNTMSSNMLPCPRL